MKIQKTFEKDGYHLRLAGKTDAETYYHRGFAPIHPEVARLTGSPLFFPKETVISFFLKCIDDPDRYDFLILDPEGQIIGESVLNEIDWDSRCANFRIAIFHPEHFGKGVGSWAAECTRDFAFGELRLHRIELSVFTFNPRAEHVYAKAGFRRIGKIYDDEILMSMSAEDWKHSL